MTPEMQTAFRSMSEARGLWAGAEIATHQDLSALFVVRAWTIRRDSTSSWMSLLSAQHTASQVRQCRH
jgi:hypothetical protein